MSLNGALQVGRSAMNVSQTALQVAGDNMANAATPGFHRRTVHLTPNNGQQIGPGQFIGQGVKLQTIRREIDTAMQSRYRDALGREYSSMIDQRYLTTLEGIQNELTDNDLSTLMSNFFNGFSELANNPQDNAIRGVVVQEGISLANRLSSMRSDYGKVQDEINRALDGAANRVNDLLNQVSRLNEQITTTEAGAGELSSLRDARDQQLDELAKYLDISVYEQPNGNVDVHVNSVPIVLGGDSRGVEIRKESVEGQLKVTVRVKDDGTQLDVRDGEIGGLLRQKNETVDPAIAAIDKLAGQLIFQVNRLHSQGQGKQGFVSIEGATRVANTTDTLNAAAADVPFEIRNGSFFVHVTHQDTGVRTTHEIKIDGNADSLEDLVDRINNVVGVPNITAGINASGQLTLGAATGFEISFSDDTSGALAALGVNTFFTGSNAADIDVNQLIQDDPSMLAAGAGHILGSNDTATAIANLQDNSIQELGNKSLREFWQNQVTSLGTRASAANSNVNSSRVVREGLGAQIQAVSGVSLDEESINLLTFQRQFQAAARYISVIDETLQTLLSIA